MVLHRAKPQQTEGLEVQPEVNLLPWDLAEQQEISTRCEHCLHINTDPGSGLFTFRLFLCVDGFEPTAMLPKVPSGEYVEGTDWDALMMTYEGEF